ncbi:MAG: Trp family transcriptional regulator, partial [Chlamydiales bacterium]
MDKKSLDGWQGFLNLCKNVRTLEEFDRVFGLFFTIEEQESLAARYLII